MGVFARCALVVLVCAAATTAGSRRFAPADAPNLRALTQSDWTVGMPVHFDWASLNSGASLLAPDGVLTDEEIIALLLGPWGRERVMPPAVIDPADSSEELPDDLDDSQSAPIDAEDDTMSDIALDGLIGDGTVEDDSPFVMLDEPGFDELELVTHDEVEDVHERVAGAEVAVNTSVSAWGGHHSGGRGRGARGFGTSGTKSARLSMMDGGYFLDWPWSTRTGRNMFYWLVGPPALVFFVVGAMGIVSEMSSRSS